MAVIAQFKSCLMTNCDTLYSSHDKIPPYYVWKILSQSGQIKQVNLLHQNSSIYVSSTWASSGTITEKTIN